MLPTEPPLSLHRLVAPVPPARAQESATATRQGPTPTSVSVSNATMAQATQHSVLAEPKLVVGHDQVGNAAVAKAALRAAGGKIPTR